MLSNALTDAGYTVTGSLGTGTIMASKDGKSYSFVIVTAQYITLTVDGKVVEYVAANGSFRLPPTLPPLRRTHR